MYYGWRGKIGLISPATSPSIESDFNHFAPEGVSTLTTRILLEKVDEKGLGAMEDRAVEAARLLATAKPDLIVFGCTSGSLIKGHGYDRKLIRQMEEVSGVPCITTTTAVIAALEELKVKKVAVSTPYCDEVNEIEKKFLEDSGYEVTEIRGLGITDTCRIPKVNVDEIYHITRSLDHEKADTIFISCTGLCFLKDVPLIEKDMGKQTITSVQATLWYALKRIGITDDLGLGQLFKK